MKNNSGSMNYPAVSLATTIARSAFFFFSAGPLLNSSPPIENLAKAEVYSHTY